MLIRIVKMTFSPKNIDDFKERFHSVKQRIIGFDGCDHLELYQDKKDKRVFFTYSYWRSEEDLNRYRDSDFFKEVWSGTKKMFMEKPEAWSVDKVVSLPDEFHS